MLSLQMKMVSSLEKCFLDDAMDSKTEKNQLFLQSLATKKQATTT